jgi:hypothetical protein
VCARDREGEGESAHVLVNILPKMFVPENVYERRERSHVSFFGTNLRMARLPLRSWLVGCGRWTGCTSAGAGPRAIAQPAPALASAGGGRVWADGLSAARSLATLARGNRARAVAGGGRERKGRGAQPLLEQEGDGEDGLLRAQVVYIGAQKCFVAMHSDIARGNPAPVLAYVAPQILERGSRGKIVVGDNVLVLPGAHAYKVTRALPRLNLFQRADPEGRPKPLASNLDQLVVCCSFGSPAFSSTVLDRVLVAACSAGIPVLIVLNKVDLADDQLLSDVTATYRAAGFPVCHTSAQPQDGRDAVGIEELRGWLHGKTSALYGLSGAGKSSLLNKLAGLDIRHVLLMCC